MGTLSMACRGYREHNKQLKRWYGLALLLVLLAGPIAWGQDTADDNSTYRFDIPAQPLMQVLRDFTAVTGQQVVVQSGNVSRYTSASVSGVLTARQALTRLVADTGLRVSQSASGAFLLDEDAPNFGPERGVVIEDVFVIGSKTGATRQELATSVGYFDEERISSQAIFDVEDIFDRMANASIGNSISGAYSIRGVNTDGVAGALNSSNALASILVNQVALGVASGNYLKPSLFDAVSVEVMRGPQSSLQGPNALIGSVFINYNRPDFDGYQGAFRTEGGELDTLRLALMQNVVLAEDTLAARLVLETRQSNGDVDNTTTGRDDVQSEDEETVRLALRWQPLGSEDLVFDLTYQHNESDTNASAFVVPPPGGDLFDREQPYNIDDEFPSDFDLISLEASWQMNDRWLFTSVTGASDFLLDQRFDGDLSALDLLTVSGFIEEELFSQELRLNYESDRISALLGLFYSDGDYTNGFAGMGVRPDGMGGIVPFNTATDNTENIEQQAVFGQLSWRPVDDWEFTLGARFNHEERNTDDFADNTGVISDLSLSTSFDQFIPSLTIAHDLNDSTRVGASYSRGFQAGGVAFAVFLGQATPYDEEFIDNYELFLRYQSPDGRLLVNANIFHFDWSDQQVTTTLPGGAPGFDDTVANAGESEVTGAELELEWQATGRLNLFASLGIIDTEFKEFVVNGVDLAGMSFSQSPDVTATFGGRYVSERGLFATATYSYTDDTFSRITAPEITQISARSLLSGRLGYQRGAWQAYVWGTNLLDDEYELFLQDGRVFGLSGAYGSIGPPRTLGVGLQLNW